MKKIIKIFRVLLCGFLIFSCSKSEEVVVKSPIEFVKLQLTASNLRPEVGEDITFKVSLEAKDVTELASVYINEVLLESKTFSSTVEGTFTAVAKLESARDSDPLEIEVVSSLSQLILSAKPAADSVFLGTNLTFFVELDQEDVTSSSQIYAKETLIEGRDYKVEEVGQISFVAKREGALDSNVLSYVVLPLPKAQGFMEYAGKNYPVHHTDVITYFDEGRDDFVLFRVTNKDGSTIDLTGWIFDTYDAAKQNFVSGFYGIPLDSIGGIVYPGEKNAEYHLLSSIFNRYVIEGKVLFDGNNLGMANFSLDYWDKEKIKYAVEFGTSKDDVGSLTYDGSSTVYYVSYLGEGSVGESKDSSLPRSLHYGKKANLKKSGLKRTKLKDRTNAIPWTRQSE